MSWEQAGDGEGVRFPLVEGTQSLHLLFLPTFIGGGEDDK